MQAVVWTGSLEVRDDVEFAELGPDEVTVRVVRAGLCHSDLVVIDGTIPYPTPAVLGHEGAGAVSEVGSATSKVHVGDHVVLTTLRSCGQCAACDRGMSTHCRDTMGRIRRPFRSRGEKLFQFANTGAFGEYTVVKESQAVVIDAGVAFEAACLIGCAVVTGAGAVLNRATVQPGQSVLVIGAGGVGLSVVQARRLAGASRIVVLDANARKGPVALSFGATDFLDASSTDDPVAALHEIGLGLGVDRAFECAGHSGLIRTAVDSLDWEGTCTLVGVPKLGSEASFVVSSLYNNESTLGCRYGATRPHHDIALIDSLYQRGTFLLDEMVSAIYPLLQSSSAMTDLQPGDLNRAVLEIGAWAKVARPPACLPGPQAAPLPARRSPKDPWISSTVARQLCPDRRQEGRHRRCEVAPRRVADRDLADAQEVPRSEPGERGVDGSTSAEAPDHGVAEARGDQSLQREVVVGPVDDAWGDPASVPGLFELDLDTPPPRPRDDVQSVEHVEARTLEICEGTVATGEDHPRIVEDRDDLDALVGCGIVHEGQVEASAVEGARDRLGVLDLGEHDLGVGMVLAEQLQGCRHQLGCGGLGDPDPQPHPLSSFGLVGIGGDGLDLAERAPGPAVDRGSGGCELDPSPTSWAGEHRPPDRPLEGRHLMGERGLGVAELGRGLPEGSEVGDRDQRTESLQVDCRCDRQYRL